MTDDDTLNDAAKLALAVTRIAELMADVSRLMAEAVICKQTIADSESARAASGASVTTMNDFLSMVAHDLRSPLGVITVSASVLLKIANALEAGRPARKLVQRIQGSADLLSHYASDLLDVSSVGCHLMKMKPHGVAELIVETCDTLSALCDEKSLVLRQDIRVGQSAVVLCDKTRFLQLMSNLVGNAIKFTHRGGEITISAIEDRENYIFSVADTGVGIPEDELSHVFDHDYWRRRRNPSGVTEGGFGLGLAIVKRLVEAHGGVVSAKSVLDKGSTFTFTLRKVPSADKIEKWMADEKQR